MAQVTRSLIDSWLKLLDAGKHINSTSGEERQLCYAWIQVQSLRACLRDANGYSDEQINEIANRDISRLRLEVIK